MITSEKEYEAIVNRIEELLTSPENIENSESAGFEELNRLSDLAADYEEKSLLRDELVKGEESGISDKKMDEILKEAKRQGRKAL